MHQPDPDSDLDIKPVLLYSFHRQTTAPLLTCSRNGLAAGKGYGPTEFLPGRDMTGRIALSVSTEDEGLPDGQQGLHNMGSLPKGTANSS